MRKFGKLENGDWICQLTVEEVERLHRREGVRKNRAQCSASFNSIADDIERKYGLPSDCLRVHKPGSTDNYRRDVKIARIRRDYEA